MNTEIGTTEFAALRADCADLAATPPRTLSLSRPVWIFGAGQFARDLCKVLLAKNFNVLGFIETQPHDEQLMGLPVRSWQQLSETDRFAQLVIGIYNRGMPLNELKALARKFGFRDVMMPWDYYSQFEKQLGWRYWLSGRDQILQRLDAIEASHDMMCDAASRQCLRGIVRFRLGINDSYGSFRHEESQYFNSLTLLGGSQTPIHFIDGGAYNGDTLLDLAAIRPIKRAYLFEPDAENYSALLRNVAKKDISVHCLPLALSDGHHMLSFNAGNGEAATITANGNVHVASMALDDLLISQSTDFIKLDLEGGEIAALNGAAQLISRCRPVLAISFYHRPQDLWEIPQLLRELCPTYKFFLRQHFFNSFDSVFYAVPNSHPFAPKMV